MNTHPSALNADLYELTMAAGYYKNKLKLSAVFELFCHTGSFKRSYFISCGLEEVVDYLLKLRFSEEDIYYLRKHPAFKSVGKDFFDYLKKIRFTGDLWAMPEGTLFFPLEPIIQIRAPIIEAQIVETYLLSITHIQTIVATKASRVVMAARSDGIARGVIDFGSRRAHGPEAAVFAARAAYVGGCVGTSNTYAGIRFKIPTYGTMAHSWVEAFEREEESFSRYREVFPENTVLLIDTFDTLKGAEKAVSLKKDIQGVRIDSGRLDVLTKRVRRVLDSSGYAAAKIIASGNLDEYKILDLVKGKAPIDTFGVGTAMVTSEDLPALDLTYKLVETESPGGKKKEKAKCSPGKVTLPGRKQVYRRFDANGIFSNDIICLFTEKPPRPARGLLEPVIEKGRLVKKMPSIGSIRQHTYEELGRLPRYCSRIQSGRYPRISISPRLRQLSKKICRG